MKRHFKRHWVKYVAVYLIIGIFAAPFAPQEVEQEVVEPVVVDAVVEVTPVVDEKLTLNDVILDFVGESALISHGIDGEYYVVHRKFGAWGSRSIAEDDTLALIDIIYGHEDYKSGGIMVRYYGENTDVYGNKTNKQVHMAGLLNETIEKVNFDGVDGSNLVKIADEYEVFLPAFK